MRKKSKVVIVILAAYNGSYYISEQIKSILNQSHKASKLIISVDLSDDDTLSIVQNFAKSFSKIKISNSTKRFGSAAKNFIDMLENAELKNVDYIALSDQDDLWNKDKLEKAIEKLEQGYDGYSSNVEAFWVNGQKKVLVKNQLQQNFDFLFESAGPGCTFVLTKKLAINLQNFLKVAQNHTSQMKQYHDWLIYAFARANGYKWFIDSYVSMQYRQHSLNNFGAHVGFSAFFKRVKSVLVGEGFDQVLRLIKILKLENDPFVKQWYPLSRIGFIKLAFYAPQCRRRLREKIYFFFVCILLAIIFPKKIRAI
jgi:rhamnosyltransferase